MEDALLSGRDGPKDEVAFYEWPQEKILEYAKELWNLANVMAGFCILQTLAFLSNAGQHCSPLGLAVSEHHGVYSISVITVVEAAELALIFSCYRGQRQLLARYNTPAALLNTFRGALAVRTIIVILCTLLMAAFILDCVFIERRWSDLYLKACGFNRTEYF